MKYGHIITVGTSLLTNTGGHGAGGKRPGALQELEGACKGLDNGVTGPNIEQKRETAKKALLKLDPAQEFGYRPPRPNKPRDRLPQELSYLWAFAQKGRESCTQRDQVRFLASDTNDSKNCALIICEVLNCEVLNTQRWSQWYEAAFNVDKDFSGGVDATKGSIFQTTGIQQWMAKIQEMVKELSEAGCERILLNVTGGYKGTVPYSTLMGMLHRDKVEIAYLFEESHEIIFIPAYPVGLDFREWHENALRLRMARKLRGKTYFIPARPVHELLQDDQSLSAFGRALEKQYEKQLTTDPLKFYSRNIITRLLHDKGPWAGGERPAGAGDAHHSWDANEVRALRDILHNLVDKVGDIIWLGDKIPEMVDHAQRHHHDLLEFTELFLTPILHHRADFLNARERFVLLYALMLHDSGHALDRISVQACQNLSGLFGRVTVEGLGEELLLFPNDVRDYHQYLAGVRLNDRDMANDLGWPGRQGLPEKGLPEELHDAVILACLYHRRRMDYAEDLDQEGILHLTGQWPGRLSAKKDELWKTCKVDMMKVVALLRLIDGCDSQTRRAGLRARVNLTLALLKRDYRTAAMRAEQAYQAFQDGPGCGRKANWEQALDKEERDANDRVTIPWALKDSERKERKIRIECLMVLRDDSHSIEEKQCARLWLMAAEAADRAQMRFGQFNHFMKHRAVTEIHVLPADDFGPNNFAFNVILVPDSGDEPIQDPRDPSRCGTVKSYWLDQCLFKPNVSLRKSIEEEVYSEYDRVAKYAAEHLGLRATYWWEDEWGNRESGGQPFYPESENGSGGER